MKTIRIITRYVPRVTPFAPPCAQRADVRLVQGNAAPDGNGPCGAHYATEPEAQAEADRRAPYWHHAHNKSIRDRLQSSIQWQGTFMGPGVLADFMGVSRDTLYLIAQGRVKATRAHVKGAQEYHGQRSAAY